MLSFSRIIFLIHRYFGIGLGLIVTLWCLSGFVMMYVAYPEVSAQDRLAASPYLALQDCCLLPSLDEFSDIAISGARVAMWPQGPTLFLSDEYGGQHAIDLQTSEYLVEITQDMAADAARQYSREFGLGADLALLGTVELDQWTVYQSFIPLRPFYQYQPQDSRGTILYVSSVTGEVVQHTDRNERFFNWIGAVVHWIYPAALRQNETAWFWTVVILSGLSLFLTITGVYVAIRYLNFKRDGRLSPFHGWGLWHHYIGLAFGLLTLTWLLSGLLSMTPFSALEGRNADYERSVVTGRTLSFDESIRQNIRQLSAANIPSNAVSIEFSIIGGETLAVITDKSGERVRYNPNTWDAEVLEQSYFLDIAPRIKPNAGIASQGWITEQDSYYYSRRTAPLLPAYRVIYDDGERAYFNAISGELSDFVDKPRQWNRWLYNGLHSLDFNNFIRQRPLWDILVLLLLAGVTAGAVTGTWLGWKRLTKT